jgi:hypothetical protein
MPDQAGTAQWLALEFAHLLAPLAGRLGDDGVLDTFEELGVRFPDAFLEQPAITAARATVTNADGDREELAAGLVAAIDAGDAAAMAGAALALVAQCAGTVASLDGLAAAIRSAGPTLPGISAAQVAELTTDLRGNLVALLLADRLELSPAAGAVLAVFGVLERTFQPGDADDPTRPPYEKVAVRLDRLAPALTDPRRLLRDLYGWGTASFDAERLFRVLETALGRLGLPALLVPPTATTPVTLQVFGLDLRPTVDGRGLRLDVVLPGQLDAAFPVEVSPPVWTAEVGVRGELPVGTTGEVRPPFSVGLTPPSGAPAGEVTVSLRGDGPEPIVVLGQAGGSRLEFDRFNLTGGLTVAAQPGGLAAPAFQGEITGGRLVVDASTGDGFLATILNGRSLDARFDLRLTATPETGVRFAGSTGLTVQIPVHGRLGPIETQAVYLAAALAGDSLEIETSAAFTVRLGPVQATVDRVGVRADIGFPEGGGNLGPAQLGFAFQPPRGVGLALDLDVVRGGGFLAYDPERQEYAGAVELELADFLALKGIGLLTTRMPDGSRGFSLLIVLTAEFPEPGLQLGFGFRLLAVGGLVGLNRTVRIPALMDGVRTGAIESLMFPRDVIANAPRILSDLRTFFPPERDRFLIGPMLKLAWGSPAVVTASLAVVVEIPGNIAFVGVLKVALPTERAPLLLLQVNFAGVVEPDQQRLYFSASLFESRVLHLTIDGDMGVLVAWGNDPNLVITVGGFHPSFDPPPLPFPTPRRISLDILNESNARIRASGYFAVTSNTAQFGAQAELYFKFSAFRVEAEIGFDALFQLSPFAFAIEVRASASLKAFGVGCFGINLRFALEGPTPWRAHGRGGVSLFFFDISADFDVTWGEHRDTLLPPVRVLPILAAELAKPENWQTRSPGVKPLVTLRRPAATEDELVLHPMGTLFVRQRAVPLDLKLDRVGAQRPSDADRFTVQVTGGTLAKRADAEELFAPAQFQDMDDAAKLSRPAFQRQHAGLELAPDGAALASARAVRRAARYEEIIIDTANRRASRRFTELAGGLFTHLLRGNSVSRSPLSRAQRSLKQPFAETIRVTGETFAVARTRDNTAAAPAFGSEAAAREFLAGRLVEDPGLAGTLHVIPGVEVNG